MDKKTILVVDDNAVIRKLTQMQLGKFGLQCRFAEDGESAVSFCKSFIPDLIFMDVKMPGMDGLEATRQIRSTDTAFAAVPIVGMTADGIRQDCINSGMNDFLQKPVMLEHLQTVLSKWLPKARAL